MNEFTPSRGYSLEGHYFLGGSFIGITLLGPRGPSNMTGGSATLPPPLRKQVGPFPNFGNFFPD